MSFKIFLQILCRKLTENLKINKNPDEIASRVGTAPKSGDFFKPRIFSSIPGDVATVALAHYFSSKLHIHI
jgi:hypothetical protein